MVRNLSVTHQEGLRQAPTTSQPRPCRADLSAVAEDLVRGPTGPARIDSADSAESATLALRARLAAPHCRALLMPNCHHYTPATARGYVQAWYVCHSARAHTPRLHRAPAPFPTGASSTALAPPSVVGLPRRAFAPGAAAVHRTTANRTGRASSCSVSGPARMSTKSAEVCQHRRPLKGRPCSVE